MLIGRVGQLCANAVAPGRAENGKLNTIAQPICRILFLDMINIWSSIQKNPLDVRHALEFQSIAATVTADHRPLLAQLSLVAYLRFTNELYAGPVQLLLDFLELLVRDNKAEVTNGRIIAGYFLPLVTDHIIDGKMGDQMMAEEIIVQTPA